MRMDNGEQSWLQASADDRILGQLWTTLNRAGPPAKKVYFLGDLDVLCVMYPRF